MSWKRYIFIVTTITKAELWLILGLLSVRNITQARSCQEQMDNLYQVVHKCSWQKIALNFLKFPLFPWILQVNIWNVFLFKQEIVFLAFTYQYSSFKIQRRAVEGIMSLGHMVALFHWLKKFLSNQLERTQLKTRLWMYELPTLYYSSLNERIQ